MAYAPGPGAPPKPRLSPAMPTAHHTPVHSFHIPVMGTGYTVDTPLKVARYGIASVVSLVDDVLLEQMRLHIGAEHGVPCEPIPADSVDSRARRTTAYLDLLHRIISRQIEEIRVAPFESGSEIARYFELLPPSSLREQYEQMCATDDPSKRRRLQDRLRNEVVPGPIDVNIMTKLDRSCDLAGRDFGEDSSDALSAFRGFMNSQADGSVVLSAGMNPRLFAYMAQFEELVSGRTERARKRIVLKVSDFRSASIQGRQLAKFGLHVSEFRVESGLNCGGHAFGSKGQLMGPVLDEFRKKRDALSQTLRSICSKARAALGFDEEPTTAPARARLTAQGGLGESQEDRLLHERYGVDGTGWGSPFLFVPEVVNIDPTSLDSLQVADVPDIVRSGSSPLGVPFWSLRTSASEEMRRERIADGKPGSPCPKGFLAFNTEFTETPICTASRSYQRRKLAQIEQGELASEDREHARESVLSKACLCHDLAGGATGPTGIEPDATTALCCGPNAAYFSQVTTLEGMVDHIYGRVRLAIDPERPHLFMKELSLNLQALRQDLADYGEEISTRFSKTIVEYRENLQDGLQHYRELASEIVAEQREAFLERLDSLQEEFADLLPSLAPEAVPA